MPYILILCLVMVIENPRSISTSTVSPSTTRLTFAEYSYNLIIQRLRHFNVVRHIMVLYVAISRPIKLQQFTVSSHKRGQQWNNVLSISIHSYRNAVKDL